MCLEEETLVQCLHKNSKIIKTDEKRELRKVLNCVCVLQQSWIFHMIHLGSGFELATLQPWGKVYPLGAIGSCSCNFCRWFLDFWVSPELKAKAQTETMEVEHQRSRCWPLNHWCIVTCLSHCSTMCSRIRENNELFSNWGDGCFVSALIASLEFLSSQCRKYNFDLNANQHAVLTFWTCVLSGNVVHYLIRTEDLVEETWWHWKPKGNDRFFLPTKP